MFEVKRDKEITQIMMGSDINGQVLYSVAAYLVDGLLIDTGCHNTRWELVDYLSNHQVSTAVNTHHHLDHIGGNKLIKERLRLPIFAPQESLPLIARNQAIFSYQEELWGRAEPCLVEALGDTVHTNRYTFEVVRTGGHSRDHVVFFLKERGWLFTGDEFLAEKPNTAVVNEDNRRALRASKQMAALEPELLITASGMIFRNGSDVLKRHIAYFEEIKEQVHTLKKTGLSPKEIVSKLFGGEAPLKEFTRGRFCRENFVNSFFISDGD